MVPVRLHPDFVGNSGKKECFLWEQSAEGTVNLRAQWRKNPTFRTETSRERKR
jgi:hypothetical protein